MELPKIGRFPEVLSRRGDSKVEILVDSESAPQAVDTAVDNNLRIILCRASDPQLCSFWVGLYKSRGHGSSHQFLDFSKIDEAFRFLSEVGIADDQPLMFSDNSGEVHRQFYLLPDIQFSREPEQALHLVLQTLEALDQKKVGLYLSPALLKRPEMLALLSSLVEGFAKLKTKEVYLLTTDIGLNQLLNVSLNVKRDLQNRRDVWIFH